MSEQCHEAIIVDIREVDHLLLLLLEVVAQRGLEVEAPGRQHHLVAVNGVAVHYQGNVREFLLVQETEQISLGFLVVFAAAVQLYLGGGDVGLRFIHGLRGFRCALGLALVRLVLLGLHVLGLAAAGALFLLEGERLQLGSVEEVQDDGALDGLLVELRVHDEHAPVRQEHQPLQHIVQFLLGFLGFLEALGGLGDLLGCSTAGATAGVFLLFLLDSLPAGCCAGDA